MVIWCLDKVLGSLWAYIANLTLWFYENSYLEVLYRTDYFSAKLLNKTYRLIDDITTINTDGIFKKHMSSIYPASLILNKENERDDSAHCSCAWLGYPFG